MRSILFAGLCFFVVTLCSCSRWISNSLNFTKVPHFFDAGELQTFYPSELNESTPAVILIHGIVMNGYHMSWAAWNFAECGYYSVVYDYPTRLKSIDGHGADFRVFLKNFIRSNPNRKIHILSHSMGGLVTRYALSEMTPEEINHIDSVVMLAPPNQGSIVAWYICEHLTSLSTVFQPVPELSNMPGGRWLKIPELCGVRFGIISAYYDFLVPEYSVHLPKENMFLMIPMHTHMTIPFSSDAIHAAVRFFGDSPEQD